MIGFFIIPPVWQTEMLQSAAFAKKMALQTGFVVLFIIIQHPIIYPQIGLYESSLFFCRILI